MLLRNRGCQTDVKGYPYVLNNPLKFIDPSGYSYQKFLEAEALNDYNPQSDWWYDYMNTGAGSGRLNPNPGSHNNIGRFVSNPGPTGAHYDKVTEKMYYSYQDPITGEDNAYYTDSEGNVVSSDAGGHYIWRTKAVYYDDQWLIYTRNGIKKTALDYDVVNFKHYFTFTFNSGVEKGPMIPGIYDTSWKNLGYQVRNIEENLKYGKPGSKRRGTGQAPAVVKLIVSPMLTLPNAWTSTTTGYDVYENQISIAQRVYAPFSAVMFLFPSPVANVLSIPEESLYILDPAINMSLKK